MAVNTKMGVDISAFRAGIKEGQAALKSLNAEMKAVEAEFKVTGDAEKLMADKTKTLNNQLNTQKGIVDQAQKALDTMTKAGVDPADQAYQQLYATLMNAQAGMYQTQAAINNLGATTEQAATGADKLTQSVNSIGKKISLDQVITGIGKITDGLENAAKKAVKLGEDIWNSIMDSAKWADDTATMAQMYGIDIDTFQRMQKLVTNGMDTTVEAILKAQSKLKKGIGSESDSISEALEEIGVSFENVLGFDKYGGKITEARDQLELFFEAGQKILELGDQNKQEDLAQKLFGRSWHELVPLFESYKTVEEYRDALAGVTVNSEETVNNLTALNDKVGEVQGNLQTVWREILGQIAPALTTLADSLNGVLEEINAYLKTEDGQAMLKSLGDTISTLFEDLGKIDPKTVVENFTSVFNSLVDGLKWIVDNRQTLVDALKYVVIGWGTLKLAGGALDILRLINGIKGLGSGGTPTTPVTTGGGEPAAAAASGVGPLAALSGKLSGMVTSVANWVSYNGGPYMDWLTHESPFGTLFQGTESFGDWAARMKGDIENNASTFFDDWKGLIKNLLGLGDTGASQEWQDDEEALRQMIEDDLNAEPFDFVAEPQVPEDSAEQISQQIGAVPVTLMWNGKFWGAGGVGGSYLTTRANGLPYVPYDGYLAALHKGEMVVPAREVSNSSYSSNLYVESMIMNNGTDAEGLAAAMAAAQRRTMSGYGS